MKSCPCGSQKSYDECCAPLIAGTRQAQSAAELMRSRYSAYVEREIPYLRETLHPDHRADYDEKSSREWSEKAEWHGLEIVSSTDGGPEDEKGEVEFIARFSLQGERQEHHERSSFARRGGRWYFVSGKEVKPQPVVRESPKIGRNDPCPCGSGRKHKKCCGAA